MLNLVVTYNLKEGFASNFVGEVEDSGAADKVRAEDGCIRYDYFWHGDIPNRVILLEAWDSLEKQKIHLQQHHMNTIRHIREKYCESVSVDLFPEGYYRHYKGNIYELMNIAMHSETLEPMVVYRALYGNRGIWVRPASMWNQTVEIGGEQVKRFTLIEDDKQ